MNINECKLSVDDKIFMLSNDKYFPLDIKTSIRSNSKEWEQDILKEIPSFEFNHQYNKKYEIKNKINEIPDEMIKSYVKDMYSSPWYTKEDIRMNLNRLNKLISLIKDSSCDVTLLYWIFSRVILYKLKAYEINLKINNPDLLKFNNITYLFDKLLVRDNYSYEYAAVLIYMIYQLLDVKEENIHEFNSLIRYRCISNKDENNEKLMSYVKDLSENRIDLISYLDKFNLLCDDNILEISGEIPNFNKNSILIGKTSIDNFDKNRIEFEISSISKDVILDYIGNYSNISFSIQESNIAFLINENVPLIKLFIKNLGMRTICHFNDDMFLLFSVESSNVVYGISFPLLPDDSRKIITIEIPTNKLYRLTM